MHTCKCACTYACVMHICTYKCMCAYMHICMHVWCICTYACVMHVCMHTSAHLHICPHTCTWTHAFTWAHNASIGLHMWGLKVVIKVIIQLIFKIFSLSQCILLQCIIIGSMHCSQLADNTMSAYCWKPANGVTRHPWQFTGATTQIIIILAHLCRLFPALAVVASICHGSPAHAGEWMKDILHIIRL